MATTEYRDIYGREGTMANVDTALTKHQRMWFYATDAKDGGTDDSGSAGYYDASEVRKWLFTLDDDLNPQTAIGSSGIYFRDATDPTDALVNMLRVDDLPGTVAGWPTFAYDNRAASDFEGFRFINSDTYFHQPVSIAQEAATTEASLSFVDTGNVLKSKIFHDFTNSRIQMDSNAVAMFYASGVTNNRFYFFPVAQDGVVVINEDSAYAPEDGLPSEGLVINGDLMFAQVNPIIYLAAEATGTFTITTNTPAVGEGTDLVVGAGLGAAGYGDSSLGLSGSTSGIVSYGESYQIDVKGSMYFASGNDMYLRFSDSAAAGQDLYIQAQTSSGDAGGSLYLESGDGSGDVDGNIYINANAGIVNVTGNVGIGTATPTVELEVYATGAGVQQRITTSVDGFDMSLRFIQAATTKAIVGYDDSDDVVKLVYGTAMGDTTGISIDSSGNVGIGTTTATELLNLNGDQMFTSDADRKIYVQGVTGANNGKSLTIRGGASDAQNAGSLYLRGGAGVDEAGRGSVHIDNLKNLYLDPVSGVEFSNSRDHIIYVAASNTATKLTIVSSSGVDGNNDAGDLDLLVGDPSGEGAGGKITIGSVSGSAGELEVNASTIDLNATTTTIAGAVTIEGVNGINYSIPGDGDIDLATVDVVGTPRLYWDESLSSVTYTNTTENSRFVLDAPAGKSPMIYFSVAGTLKGLVNYDESATELTMRSESGIPLILKTNGNNDRIVIASAGGITIPGLAGTGTRNVVVDANGVLSAP